MCFSGQLVLKVRGPRCCSQLGSEAFLEISFVLPEGCTMTRPHLISIAKGPPEVLLVMNSELVYKTAKSLCQRVHGSHLGRFLL